MCSQSCSESCDINFKCACSVRRDLKIAAAILGKQQKEIFIEALREYYERRKKVLGDAIKPH